MAPAAITPESSGTTTPVKNGRPGMGRTLTEDNVSGLTLAGMKHALPQTNGASYEQAPLDASLMTVELNKSPRAVPEPESAEVAAQVRQRD